MQIKQKVFFLGGHDLEMATIRSILDEEEYAYVDKNLSWWNACLSEYQTFFEKYPENEYDIYGVELKENINPPDNYFSLDHHGIYQDRPSSLEQVCRLLHHKMTRHEKLVAANDERYIPGMLGFEASTEEIDYIRHQDQREQGVTEEDEAAALKALREHQEHYSNLICVYSETSKFSPIVDRLFPKTHILVYTDSELTYYGRMRDTYLDALQESYPTVTFYSGGGINGYLGVSGCTKEIIDSIVDYIKNMQQAVSEHIFMFPFIWEDNKHHDVKTAFKAIAEIKNCNWERVKLTAEDNEKPDIYNEQNYFYPFTHDTIYDREDGSHIRHFERKEPKSRDVRYVIETTGKTYSLKVTKMHLNFYATGVGVLSFFTENMDYPDELDILSINQFGRRVFVPFSADASNHFEIPCSLSINGLDKEYSKAFVPESMMPNTPATFIKDLICNASKNINNILPVLDDRMFVMSWYRCTTRDCSSNKDYNRMLSEDDNFLYKYTFVDTIFPSCQNLDMRQKLLQSSIYDRWQQWGTLYGLSRYSFVMLTTIGCPDYLIRYFETEYERMTEMVLVQRASILRLSRVLKDSTNSEYNDFKKHYAEYIDFLSKFRFVEVSAQDQAIELYYMLSEKLRIRNNAEHLDRQFNEVQEYLELNSQRHLNLWAAILVPVSLLSACYTFLFHDEFALDANGCFGFLNNSGPVLLIISIFLSAIFGYYYFIRSK